MSKNRQGYTGFTRVYTWYTRVCMVYKSIQAIQEYTGYRYPGNEVVQGIWSIQGDTGCTKAHRVYKSIQGVLWHAEHTRCASPISG